MPPFNPATTGFNVLVYRDLDPLFLKYVGNNTVRVSSRGELLAQIRPQREFRLCLLAATDSTGAATAKGQTGNYDGEGSGRGLGDVAG
jgi:hypothetical protein